MIVVWFFCAIFLFVIGVLVFGFWEHTKKVLSDIGGFFVGIFLFPLLVLMSVFGRNIEIKLGGKTFSVNRNDKQS